MFNSQYKGCCARYFFMAVILGNIVDDRFGVVRFVLATVDRENLINGRIDIK